MNQSAKLLLLTLSAAIAEPNAAHNAIDDDINQLMKRFMFEDYRPSVEHGYGYHQHQESEQIPHLSPEESRPPKRSNTQHKKTNQDISDKTGPMKANSQSSEKSNILPKKLEKNKVDPKLRDFTLIISKLLFHLSQL